MHCVCAQLPKLFAPTSAGPLIKPKLSDEWEADTVVKKGEEGSRPLCSFFHQINVG